jgi:hypothetical protein
MGLQNSWLLLVSSVAYSSGLKMGQWVPPKMLVDFSCTRVCYSPSSHAVRTSNPILDWGGGNLTSHRGPFNKPTLLLLDICNVGYLKHFLIYLNSKWIKT